jgi:hypothetical protein
MKEFDYYLKDLDKNPSFILENCKDKKIYRSSRECLTSPSQDFGKIKQWVFEQKKYLRGLSKSQLSFLNEYAGNKLYPLLNTWLRGDTNLSILWLSGSIEEYKQNCEYLSSRLGISPVVFSPANKKHVKLLLAHLEELAQTLSEVISNAPESPELILYRGTKEQYWSEDEQTFTQQGFMSATMTMSLAEYYLKNKGCCIKQLLVPAKTRCLFVSLLHEEGLGGSDEYEILFQASSRLKIVDREIVKIGENPYVQAYLCEYLPPESSILSVPSEVGWQVRAALGEKVSIKQVTMAELCLLLSIDSLSNVGAIAKAFSEAEDDPLPKLAFFCVSAKMLDLLCKKTKVVRRFWLSKFFEAEHKKHFASFEAKAGVMFRYGFQPSDGLLLSIMKSCSESQLVSLREKGMKISEAFVSSLLRDRMVLLIEKALSSRLLEPSKTILDLLVRYNLPKTIGEVAAKVESDEITYMNLRRFNRHLGERDFNNLKFSLK